MVIINSLDHLENINNFDNIIIHNEIINNFIMSLDKNIKKCANIAYKDNSKCSIDSFKKQSEILFNKAIISFYKNKHFLNKREIEPYLARALKYEAIGINKKLNPEQRQKKFKCPICKCLLKDMDNGLLSCSECESKLQNLKYTTFCLLEKEATINYYSSFATHSKSGVKCPDCGRFVPTSVADINGNICCPHLDCFAFFNESDVKKIAHPVFSIYSNHYSIDHLYVNSKGALVQKNESHINQINNFKTPENIISTKENVELKFNIVKKCISDYKRVLLKSSNSCTNLQMQLMCEAYENMLKNHPAEMIQYLFSNKGSGGNSLQSRIFQEYCSVVENSMPIQICRRKSIIDIFDLCDPNLSLFEQVSEFESFVDGNVIHNETKEEYCGSRGGKFYGKYNIGKVISIECEDKLINDNIRDYTFHNINLCNYNFNGKKVKVKHYSILPHYEIGSLVYLRKVKTELFNRVTKANELVKSY